jgi:serine/threonine protein kinase
VTVPTGTRLGPYEVLAPLGAGGMGEVYKARDARLDRIVAIKVLPPQLANDPQFRQRFQHEARAISALDHPHICTLYDIGEHDGTSFLVMQYLEGETLEARIQRGPLAVEQALHYAVQIAGALNRAHSAGIVHRDLKPGNVMLTKGGAKLLDFGLSKTTVSGGAAAGLSMLPTTPPGLTAQGTILGTFQYMAPEQLEGHDADARTDIFAFGAVLYEMLTGQKAFEGKSQASLIGAILKDEPPAPSTLQPLAPRALDRVVRACLAKNPDDRWQSARDLEREIAWVADAGSDITSETAKDRSARQLLVTRIVATLLGTALVVSIGASFLRGSNSARATDRHLIRFTVPTEANLFGNYFSTGFALSPDGRTLAYVDAAGPSYKLLTRSVDNLESRTLVTGNDVRQPFWSPDSRYIGFFSNGILKKVDVVDGTSQTVCALPLSPGPSLLVSGGTWGEDDTILFALRTGPDALYRVSASGGTATKVEIQSTPQLRSFRWPQFLPGGRRFLGLGMTESASGLYLSTLDGTASKSVKVLDTDYMSQYAEPGYLLFVRDGGLFAQPFNADTGSLSGTPLSLVQGIAVSPDVNLRNAGFSVAGTGGLVYRTNSSRKRLTWLDRNGNEQGVVGEPDNYDEAELSPDGSQIVVEVNDKNGFGDIWVMNAGRGTRVPLTRTPGRWEYSPRWSPDGQYIAYAEGITIRRRRSDGSGEEEKLADITPPSLIFPRDWTRDGRILFTRLSGGLFSVAVSPNSQPSPLDDGAGNGRVSADGRWLAYTSFETGQNEVYVRSFAGGPRTRVSTEGGQSPVWRRTGSELYYWAADGSMMSVTIRNGERLDVDIPRPLFKLRVAAEGVVRPLFSTIDGQRFLVRFPDAATAPPITWVVNWAALLDSRR